jgi:hypothetical protein
MSFMDLRWTGSPVAMATALENLGHPEYAEEGVAQDSRIVAFGPVEQRIVGGRAVVFALLRVAEGQEIAAPAGVFVEDGALHEAATGIFMGFPTTLTIRQFLLGLATDGIITKEEAIAAASTGAVPEFVANFFSVLPEEDAFAAELTWRAMIEVERTNPLLALLGQNLGMDGNAMDLAFERWSAF